MPPLPPPANRSTEGRELRVTPYVVWLSGRIRLAERSWDWAMAAEDYAQAERIDEDLQAYRLLIRMEGVV